MYFTGISFGFYFLITLFYALYWSAAKVRYGRKLKGLPKLNNDKSRNRQYSRWKADSSQVIYSRALELSDSKNQ